MNDRMYPEELMGPPLVPPPPPANYHPIPRFTKNPYVQQPMQVPPVPRHANTPPRANGRLNVQQYPLIQQQQQQQQHAQQNLSPIRSASETESGSPLGGLSVRPPLSSLVKLQKSPSAPPLKQQRPTGGVSRFEFPGPPRTSTGRGLRHRSDESLSGIGSSMRGEAYSTRIHSSADDVSSANRSERSASETEDSSSDESYTKTEAEVDPDSPGTSPGHFRLPGGGVLPMSLDIEKAWSRMNAEFAPERIEPAKTSSPKTTTSAANQSEAIELKGVYLFKSLDFDA